MNGSTAEALALAKEVVGKGLQTMNLNKAGITSSSLLYGYPLEAPSKKLFPVLTPLRNRFPRVQASTGGIAAHWKVITGINTANLEGSVAFGARNSAISYATAEKLRAFKTFGMDDVVDDEAVWMGKGFEDVRAESALATLQSAMIEEETILLGGVGVDNGLSQPANPTVTVVDSGGSIAAASNLVSVVALPLYGFKNSTLAALGRHSLANATPQAATTTGGASVISANVALVTGAVAYAWFVGVSGSQKLEAITTINSVRLESLAGTGQNLTAIVANTSADTNCMDGIIPQLFEAGVGTVIVNQANGVDGTGTPLTADANGGIEEFDTVLKNLWDNRKIAPTLIIANSQEALAITRKITGANPLGYRINVAMGSNNLVGGLFVGGYLNKFASSINMQSAGGSPAPDVIPVMVHPSMPPGTVLFLSEKLPYPTNQVPNVFEVEVLREYADYEWGRVQRRFEHGVYACEVLKVYFPAGCAIIRNIGADA